MKVRKGQSVLKLKPEMDFIERVSIMDKQGIFNCLQAKTPEKVIPATYLGSPSSYCFIAGKIFLNCKVIRATEIEVIGGIFSKQ